LVNWPIVAPINEEMAGNVLDHEWMIAFSHVTRAIFGNADDDGNDSADVDESQIRKFAL
jgi:hypothetical protein